MFRRRPSEPGAGVIGFCAIVIFLICSVMLLGIWLGTAIWEVLFAK